MHVKLYQMNLMETAKQCNLENNRGTSVMFSIAILAENYLTSKLMMASKINTDNYFEVVR